MSFLEGKRVQVTTVINNDFKPENRQEVVWCGVIAHINLDTALVLNEDNKFHWIGFEDLELL